MTGQRWSKRNVLATIFAIFIVTTLYDLFHEDSHISRLSHSAIDWYLPTSSHDTLVADPHRQYPTADSFRRHFDAVLRLPPLKIADTKATCKWSEKDEEEINFQFGGGQFGPAVTDWVLHDRNESEIDERRQSWQNYIKNDMIPWDTVRDRFSGRGIVILAGNGNTFKRLEVLLRALNRHNCQLPVEIHYWKSELDDEGKKHLTSIYASMFFNDLSTPDNLFKPTATILANYQFKSAALFNSRFAEPLLLDSDNIPAMNPEKIWESKTYKEFGTVFWPDIARTYPQNPIWAITNTPCRMDEYEQESGQLLVNKVQYFYHLQLAAWLNNGGNDGVYREFLLGDKDIFRFAWHALKTPYGRPMKWLTSIGIVQDDNIFCGHSFGQYHPDSDGEIAFVHGGLLKTIPLEGLRHWRDTGGLFRDIKRSPKEGDWSFITSVGIRFRNGENIEAIGGGYNWACTDMFKVQSESVERVLPGFEGVFKEIGGYWLVVDKDKEVGLEERGL